MTDDKEINEFERTMEGCYGSQVDYELLGMFIDDCLAANDVTEKSGDSRFSICIWGHSGIGKTQLVKGYAKKKVVWREKQYDGYDVRPVPIAQFEEMGDIHGMPEERVLMFLDGENGRDERWVPAKLIASYREEGYRVDTSMPTRTMYAPPDWVPLRPGPSILLLDDWNRTSIRIIKGCMQLLQDYGTVSWKLPPGCTIVLTGNPDEQDYLVTSIDKAILTRIKSVTLLHDAEQWAVWAAANGCDGRGINFILRYPEMLLGRERTNPRTLTEFFRYLNLVGDMTVESNRQRAKMQAHGLLDDETVAAMFVFFEREMEMIVEPQDIIRGDPKATSHVKDLMSRQEKRLDILGIICERLYGYVVRPEMDPEPDKVKRFQDFITLDCIPDDMRHSVCRRIAKVQDDGKSQRWLIGDVRLKKLILDTLR